MAWEPPRRLAYLRHLGTDRSRATEVDISFTGRAGVTVVTIVHRGWDRLGADAPAWRDRNLGGWNGLLPHYRQAIGSWPRPGAGCVGSSRSGQVRVARTSAASTSW